MVKYVFVCVFFFWGGVNPYVFRPLFQIRLDGSPGVVRRRRRRRVDVGPRPVAVLLKFSVDFTPKG